MSEELKRCPFCGSKDVVLSGTEREDAIKAWNRRVGNDRD